MSRQGQVEAPATPPASIAPKVPVVNVVTTNSAATIAAYGTRVASIVWLLTRIRTQRQSLNSLTRHLSHVVQSPAEEYMMSRQGATAVEIAPPAPVEVAPPAAAMSSYGARAPSDIWLLTRIRTQRQSLNSLTRQLSHVVQSPAEEYMMSRQGQVEAPATPLAPEAPVMPTNPIASVANAAANYDPWMDEEKTVVTFMVDGRPKKYRITH